MSQSGDQPLMNYLVGKDQIPMDQLQKAEENAAAQGISLERSLVAMTLLTPEQVGQSLAGIYNMAYKPMVDEPLAEHVRSLLPHHCAKRWNVVPIDYDRDRRILTVAVNSPDDAWRMQRINRFFLQSHSLAFLAASELEIEQAQETHYRVIRQAEDPAKATESRPKKTIRKEIEGKQRMKLTALRQAEADAQQAAQQAAQNPDQRVSGPPEFTRDEVCQTLTGAAALLVGVVFESVPERLSEAKERVRYTQLLARRLGMSPQDADRLILTAWISTLEDRPEMMRQFSTPFKLEEILFAESGGLNVESLVLSLVKEYQYLRRRDPAACNDVNSVRRRLADSWAPAEVQTGILEAFLQLLMDEEFLLHMAKAAGHILIVDPEEVTSSTLAPVLTRDGFDVAVTASAASAEELMKRESPDLVLTALDLLQGSGLDLCRRMKRDAATARIPFIMMLGPKAEKQSVECLRTGADDVIVKPVDLELLLLKIQKLVVTQQTASRSGVSGTLEDMNFPDMIQILCAGNKDLEIILETEGKSGHVFIQQGQIVHAAVDDLRGEEAFYELVVWRKGTFTTQQPEQFPERNVNTALMGLLMEAARRLDEHSAQG